MWLASPGCRLVPSPHLEATEMDHGGQGAPTPQATPSVRRRWAHSTVLGAWSASLWGLVPGAAPGGDRCPFPGKWKGLLESPIRPCGRIRPSPQPGPLRGVGGGRGVAFGMSSTGGFTHSIKEAWSRPRRNVTPGFCGPLTLAGEPLGRFITSRLLPETTPCLWLRGTAWLPGCKS